MRILIFVSVLGILASLAVLIAVIIKASKDQKAPPRAEEKE